MSSLVGESELRSVDRQRLCDAPPEQSRSGLPEGRVLGRGDSVPVRVEVLADLDRVARQLLVHEVVLDALEQERVFAVGGAHLLDALVVGAREHVPSRRHELPHSRVDAHPRTLERKSIDRSISDSTNLFLNIFLIFGNKSFEP